MMKEDLLLIHTWIKFRQDRLNKDTNKSFRVMFFKIDVRLGKTRQQVEKMSKENTKTNTTIYRRGSDW